MATATDSGRAIAARVERLDRLLHKLYVQLEREAFMDYVEAIANAAEPGGTVSNARALCPEEHDAWRAAFARAYRGGEPDA